MKGLIKKLEAIFVAITFAEEGEFETARGIKESPNVSDEKTTKLLHSNDKRAEDEVCSYICR